MQQKTNVCGAISLTLSIFSILFAGCSCVGLLFGIPALILGINGSTKKDMPTGTAIAGTIVSIVGCLFSFFTLFYFGALGVLMKGLATIFS